MASTFVTLPNPFLAKPSSPSLPNHTLVGGLRRNHLKFITVKVWACPIIDHPRSKGKSFYHISMSQIGSHLPYSTPLYAAMRSPKGFGPPKNIKKTKKPVKDDRADDDDDEDDEEEEYDKEAGVIPEIVTNRMISRMLYTVGIPLVVGLSFFPFFYYIKVVLKVDVPSWIPFIVSFVCFGTALVGVSYGIVSASWDPLREGSLSGWNEAQKNWPVFWQSIWGGSKKK